MIKKWQDLLLSWKMEWNLLKKLLRMQGGGFYSKSSSIKIMDLANALDKIPKKLLNKTREKYTSCYFQKMSLRIAMNLKIILWYHQI